MTESELMLAKLGLAASTSLTLFVAVTSAAAAVYALRSGRVGASIMSAGWVVLALVGFTLTTGAFVPNPTAGPLQDPTGWLTVQTQQVPFYVASGFLLALWVAFLIRVAPRRASAMPLVDTGMGE